MRSMSKVGRSRSIPSGPAPRRTTPSLTRAQMYRPQIGLMLGMEKKLTYAFSNGFSSGFP